MRRIATLLLLPLMCTACGEVTEDQGTASQVGQASQLEVGTILYPDIERHEIYGASCAYTEGTSLGAKVIARHEDAFLKLDGEVIRLAADPGASELPYGSRSAYSGDVYSLHLEIGGEGMQSGEEVMEYAGSIELRDNSGGVIYGASGAAQCGV
jgi:hypothetical protein